MVGDIQEEKLGRKIATKLMKKHNKVAIFSRNTTFPLMQFLSDFAFFF